MTTTKTTDEIPDADRFYAWREEKIRENPDWKDELRDWFLGMYLQTYPARTFALVSELFDFYEGRKLEELSALCKQEEDDNPKET